MTTASSSSLTTPHKAGYNHLDEGYFRLLIIHTVDYGTVRCHLETFRFADSGAYDALSYVWGKQPRSETIWNGNHAIKVTPDLKESLIHFHRHQERLGISKLWIDAVCINQDDEAEKMVQIQQMRYIYSNATQTLVWLGMSDYHSEELVPYMTEAIRLRAELPEHEFNNDFRLRSTESKNRTLGIFHHDWFTRLWVIQEAALARKVTIIYGTSVLPWNTLSAYFLTRTPYSIIDGARWPKITRIVIIMEKGITANLPFYILSMARQRQCTYEKDRILGIIGMLDPDITEVLKGLGALSTTDHEHWTSFFTRFLRTFITSCQYTPVERKPLLQEEVFDIIDSAWTAEKHETLPSWCPDWTMPQPRNSIRAQSNFHAGSRTLRDRRSYRTFTTPPVVPLPDTLHLRVHGFFTDVIESTVCCPRKDNEADILDWVETCLRICPGFDITHPQEVPDSYWRTLICNSLDTNHDCSGADVQYYYDWISWLRERTGKTAENGDNSPHGWDKALRYSVTMEMKCEARSFFTTRDGRIGLGSLGVEAGDSVCVFYGAEVCSIVRFDQGEHAPALLMGDAYVHGLMKGEGLEGRPEPDDSFFILR